MKRGPKAPVVDTEIAQQIAKNKSNNEIVVALKVGARRVARIRRVMESQGPGGKDMVITKRDMPLEKIKAIVRLELNQEETINEFSDQLAQYTQNYKLAMEQRNEAGDLCPDLDGAGKWAFLRLRLLEHMIKISGLSSRRAEELLPTVQDALNAMTDEEVEARARAILAKRQ